MKTTSRVLFTAHLRRKDPRLPVYFVVPGAAAESLGVKSTSVVETAINGHALGRRTMKAWGKGLDDWFVELPAPLMKSADLHVGDSIEVELQRADTSLPQELKREFSQHIALEVSWSKLTERQRREACEHVRSAKTLPARERRAKAIATNLALARPSGS